MPKSYKKIKECGCIVMAITFGMDKNQMHLLGVHRHHFICNTCKQEEKTGNDTLYEMWENDNRTDGLEKDGWKECR
jgi:hypothetical protein